MILELLVICYMYLMSSFDSSWEGCRRDERNILISMTLSTDMTILMSHYFPARGILLKHRCHVLEGL